MLLYFSLHSFTLNFLVLISVLLVAVTLQGIVCNSKTFQTATYAVFSLARYYNFRVIFNLTCFTITQKIWSRFVGV